MSKDISQVVMSILIILLLAGIAMTSSLFLTSVLRGNRMFSSENMIRVGLFYLIGIPIIAPIVLVLQKIWGTWKHRDNHKHT